MTTAEKLLLLRARRGLQSPLQLSDLAFWYDPYDLSSMVIDGSNRVSLWADKSPWSRVNGLVLNGAAGQYAFSATGAPSTATSLGRLNIRVRLAPTSWANGALQTLVCRWDASANCGFLFDLRPAGAFRFVVSPDGTNALIIEGSIPVPYAAFEEGRVMADYNPVTGQVDFYIWSGGAWVVHESVGNTPTNVFNSTAKIEVGSAVSGSVQNCAGIFYGVEIRVDDVLVWSPDFAAQAKLTTSFPDLTSGADVIVASSGATGARISGARDLYQGTVANQPVYSVVDGVPRLTFDGSNDFLKSAAFPFAQPETVQMVMSQVSWADGLCILDGASNASAILAQQQTTPSLALFAGSAEVAYNPDASIGSNRVVSFSFNGADSFIRVDRLAPQTGNPGTSNANGITLGAFADGTSPANITAGEIIGRSSLAATSTYEQARVIRYLARRGRIAA